MDALRADTESLRDQVGSEVTDLHERLDFAERILSRGSTMPAIEPPADQTPI